jgi:HlyD family secretion protein
MTQKKRGVLIGIGVTLMVGAFLTVSLTRSGHRGQIEVRMEPVKRERIESWVRAPGQVRPERVVQISSNVMGRVQGLAVVEGARVSRGDVLLRLDDERYRSALAGMEAQVEAGKADLQLAEAQRERSRQSLERQEQLHKNNLLSNEGLEQARTAVKIDEARVNAATEDLRQRRAVLAEAEKDIRETVFRAPIDGIVTALNVEEGENVMTGTMNNPGTVILTLANLDTMEVEADVDESDVVRIAPGVKAKVKVDAWEDSVLSGVVTSVGMSGRKGGTSAQQQATNFKVKVRITDPPAGLRPAMSADVELLSGERDSALVVPIQALVAQPERVVRRWEQRRADTANGRSKRSRHAEDSSDAALDPADSSSAARNEKMIEGIFLEREGIARFVPVKLGLRGDTQVEISGEVREGDRVVTGPYRTLRNLKDGDEVRALKPKKAGSAGAEKK